MYSRSLWIFEENLLLDSTLIILVMIWLDSLVLPFTIVSCSGHLLCLHFINRKIQDQPIPFSSMMFSFVFMPSLFRYILIDGHYGLSLHDPWTIYSSSVFHICLKIHILMGKAMFSWNLSRLDFFWNNFEELKKSWHRWDSSRFFGARHCPLVYT